MFPTAFHETMGVAMVQHMVLEEQGDMDDENLDGTDENLDGTDQNCVARLKRLGRMAVDVKLKFDLESKTAYFNIGTSYNNINYREDKSNFVHVWNASKVGNIAERRLTKNGLSRAAPRARGSSNGTVHQT